MARQTDLLNNLRVLLVEDEPITRTALHILLERQGAIVQVADSLQTAIALLNDVQPDLVITNIRLPDGNGWLILDALHAYDAAQGRQTPTIALTGESTATLRAEAGSAEFQAYIAKPFSTTDLIATILRVMGSAK